MPDDCTARPPCHDPVVFGHQAHCRRGPRSPEQLKALAETHRRKQILAHYGPWPPSEIDSLPRAFLGGIGV